jgi:RNA polymerase sigma factor (sigma-70 family)
MDVLSDRCACRGDPVVRFGGIHTGQCWSFGGEAALSVEARYLEPDLPDELQQAYAQTFDRLRRMFRARGCTPEEAADLAQDAAVRAFVHIRRWGVNGTGLDPLLNRIARNLLIDRYRRTTPHIVPLDDAGELHDPTQDPTEEVARRQRTHAVRTAIRGLPVRHQTAITYSLNGLTPEEVGKRMGIGRNAADALLHRARRSLKERLQTVGEGMFGFALGVRVRWDDLARRMGLGATTETLRSAAFASGMGALAATVAVVMGFSGSGSTTGGNGLNIRLPVAAVVPESAGQSAVAPSTTDAVSDVFSTGSGSNAGGFTFQLGPAGRSAGSGGGSTTTITGPDDGEGSPLIEGTIKNYGTKDPPARDPIARALLDAGGKLCKVSPTSCGS